MFVDRKILKIDFTPCGLYIMVLSKTEVTSAFKFTLFSVSVPHSVIAEAIVHSSDPNNLHLLSCHFDYSYK